MATKANRLTFTAFLMSSMTSLVIAASASAISADSSHSVYDVLYESIKLSITETLFGALIHPA